MVGNTNITMKTIRKAGGSAAAMKEVLLPGSYNWVWDAAADLPKDFQCDRVTVTGTALEMKLYMVIDLSSGSNSSSYPVSYLDAVPSGGWGSAYKTTKLVLRRIGAGSFIMGGDQTVQSHRMTFTKALYCGIFEVTQKQYKLITGESPSHFSGDTLPVEMVSYNAIRGSSDGSKWPSTSDVDSFSFMGKLRMRTGFSFDLPTEAQWEYVCRAGTTTTYYWGNSMNAAYVWYSENSNGQTHVVGTKAANAWGLYDMSGNVWEWCLDWSGTLVYGTDPRGPSSGATRERRGGGWSHDTSWCASAYRAAKSAGTIASNQGFRIALTLSN
jgi:formylglycine-generating enzyme required for sulfatase activity